MRTAKASQVGDLGYEKELGARRIQLVTAHALRHGVLEEGASLAREVVASTGAQCTDKRSEIPKGIRPAAMPEAGHKPLSRIAQSHDEATAAWHGRYLFVVVVRSKERTRVPSRDLHRKT